MNYVNAPTVRITDQDGDDVCLSDNGSAAPVGYITAGRGAGVNLDRERAVTLIEALTARVEALDALDAAEAATKLKAGDAVFGRYTGDRYTIVTDEEDGRADAVFLPTGRLYHRRDVRQFRRP